MEPAAIIFYFFAEIIDGTLLTVVAWLALSIHFTKILSCKWAWSRSQPFLPVQIVPVGMQGSGGLYVVTHTGAFKNHRSEQPRQ